MKPKQRLLKLPRACATSALMLAVGFVNYMIMESLVTSLIGNSTNRQLITGLRQISIALLFTTVIFVVVGRYEVSIVAAVFNLGLAIWILKLERSVEQLGGQE